MLLVFLYHWEGVLAAFFESIRGHTAQGQHSAGLAGYATAKLKSLPTCYADPSFLLAGTAFASLLGWRMIFRRNRELSRLQIAAGTLAVTLPAALHFAGKYPIYYSWMGYAAAVWGSAVELNLASRIDTPRWLRRLAVVTLASAALIGFPARMALTTLEWRSRDYELVDRLVQSWLTPQDWVYADFQAYYAARRCANLVFLPTYANPGGQTPFPQPEAQRISKLVINPESLPAVASRLGGHWVLTGQPLDSSAGGDVGSFRGASAQKYRLAVFHRENAPGTAAARKVANRLPPEPEAEHLR